MLRACTPHNFSDRHFGLAADAVPKGGEIACFNAAGWAVPGAAATGYRAFGLFTTSEDNTGGANGAKSACVALSQGRLGLRTFPLKNSGTDPVQQASVGGSCFIEDANTVAATDAGGTLSRAGKVWGFTADGDVLVEFDADYDQADLAAIDARVDDLETAVVALPVTRTGSVTLVAGVGNVTLAGITAASRITVGMTDPGAGAITGLADFRIQKAAGSFTVTAIDDAKATIATAVCQLDYIAIG